MLNDIGRSRQCRVGINGTRIDGCEGISWLLLDDIDRILSGVIENEMIQFATAVEVEGKPPSVWICKGTPCDAGTRFNHRAKGLLGRGFRTRRPTIRLRKSRPRVEWSTNSPTIPVRRPPLPSHLRTTTCAGSRSPSINMALRRI